MAAESAAAIGARHIVKVVSPPRCGRDAARSSGTSTTRSPTPRWSRCTSSPRKPASTSRWCCPARARTSCSAATRSTASRCRCEPFEYLPGRCGTRSARSVRADARGHARQGACCTAVRSTLEERYYGNARSFNDAAVARGPARLPTRVDASGRHRADLRAVARAGTVDPHAAPGPVHLAARRHPGQGRQDDHGQLAGTARAVPGHRGVRVAVAHPDGPEDHQGAPPSTRCARRWTGSCPPHVLNRAKLGFPVPLRHWLRGPNCTTGRGRRSPSRRPTTCSTSAAILRMLDEHRAGPSDHSRRLWTVLVFMIWHGIFVEKRITPGDPGAGLPGLVCSRHEQRRLARNDQGGVRVP